jgi:phospholipid/cholesterol/gamma-HCH transport system substrate-binding protein
MGVNPETKVGMLTAFTLLMLFSLFCWLNRVTFFQKGSEVKVVFERIEGLRPGAPVKYIGVDVGRINKIYFEAQHIIVVVHINQGFKLPFTSKAIIASTGVIGDKYLELQPLKPGEHPLPNQRIQGETPTSMEQLYASTYEILKSVKQSVDALNQIVADPANANSIKNALANLAKISASTERLIADNGTAFSDLVRNANTASAQLTQASATANRFLGEIADAQTTGEIKELINHINAVSASLEQFSGLLAAKGSQLVGLTDDAHQTMTAITQAAQSITTAINAFSAEDSNSGNLKSAINQAGNAVHKAGAFVKSFSRISAAQHIGMGYQSTEDTEDLAINYRADLNLSEHRGATFGITDIGHDNLSTLQYKLCNPGYNTRFGLYRNQVGLGVDWIPHSNYSLGVDLWDTHSANLGVSANWRINSMWSMSLSASRKLENDEHRWDIGCWRKF